jgi:hypothetical protein
MKITIHIYGGYLHCCTHIAAIVEDTATNKKFKIGEERIEGSNTLTVIGKDGQRRVISEENAYELEGGSGHKTITLTSSKDFNTIKTAFDRKFPKGSYNFVANNCADQVNFLLDQMFPPAENKLSTCLFMSKKTAASLLAIPALGATCLPAPLCINTPQGVLGKAEFLEKSYGESAQTPLLAPKREEMSDDDSNTPDAKSLS